MLTDAGATRSWLHDDGCAPMVTPSAARIETAWLTTTTVRSTPSASNPSRPRCSRRPTSSIDSPPGGRRSALVCHGSELTGPALLDLLGGQPLPLPEVRLLERGVRPDGQPEPLGDDRAGLLRADHGRGDDLARVRDVAPQVASDAVDQVGGVARLPQTGLVEGRAGLAGPGVPARDGHRRLAVPDEDDGDRLLLVEPDAGAGGSRCPRRREPAGSAALVSNGSAASLTTRSLSLPRRTRDPQAQPFAGSGRRTRMRPHSSHRATWSSGDLTIASTSSGLSSSRQLSHRRPRRAPAPLPPSWARSRS